MRSYDNDNESADACRLPQEEVEEVVEEMVVEEVVEVEVEVERWLVLPSLALVFLFEQPRLHWKSKSPRPGQRPWQRR